MTGKTFQKEIIKTIAVVVIGFLIIWVGVQIIFGTQNPFYVVASGSMIPVLQVYDILIVQGHISFEDIEIGDIIVFNRPSDHDRVIVHRVVSITEDDPKTVRTKGDANIASIPGTDYPVTNDEYIGKVEHVIPQLGYFTQLIKPPVNYIIIVVVIGVMILKWQLKKKKASKSLSSDLMSSDTTKDLEDIGKIQTESAYKEFEQESSVLDEKTDGLDDKKEETAGGDDKTNKERTLDDKKEETAGDDDKVKKEHTLGDKKEETAGGDDKVKKEHTLDDKKEETAGGDDKTNKERTLDDKKEETAGGDDKTNKERTLDDKKEETAGGDDKTNKERTLDDKKEETAGGDDKTNKERTLDDKKEETAGDDDKVKKEHTLDDKKEEISTKEQKMSNLDQKDTQ